MENKITFVDFAEGIILLHKNGLITDGLISKLVTRFLLERAFIDTNKLVKKF